MIYLKGKIFSIRTMTSEDITDDYLSWLNNEKVNKYLTVRNNIPSKESSITNLKKYDQKNMFMFVIFENTTNKLIGTISLNIDKPCFKTASFGYLIGDINYWGTVAAKEAISLLLDFAFGTLELRRVWGGAATSNIGAIFNFKRLGFTHEGRWRSSIIVDGNELDELLFGILKSEWNAQK